MLRHKTLKGHHYSYSYSFCARQPAAGPLRVLEISVAVVVRVVVIAVAAVIVVAVEAVQE
jgi:hypothetical protein